jgi:hypothetical protein
VPPHGQRQGFRQAHRQRHRRRRPRASSAAWRCRSSRRSTSRSTRRGTLADQCDLEHSKIYSFLASTPQTIDLTTVTDVLGGTAAFARIRFMTFKMKSTTDAATLIVGNAATNAWSAALGATGTLTLRGSTATNDGGFALWSPNTTGYVVDSTHKSLLMTPSAHAFDVDVYIFGASA